MLRYTDDEVNRLKIKLLGAMRDLTGDYVFWKHAAMLLALFSRNSKAAGEFIGYSRRAVDRWLAAQHMMGKGVDPFGYKGFKSKLRPDQQYKLRRAIRATLAGTRRRGPVDSPRALRAFVLNNFGISYTTRQARRIYQRILSDLRRGPS